MFLIHVLLFFGLASLLKASSDEDRIDLFSLPKPALSTIARYMQETHTSVTLAQMHPGFGKFYLESIHAHLCHISTTQDTTAAEVQAVTGPGHIQHRIFVRLMNTECVEDERDSSPYFRAVRHKNLELLLGICSLDAREPWAESSALIRTQLMEFLHEGTENINKLHPLILNNANPHMIQGYSFTLLHLAVGKNSLQLAHLLLHLGADVTTPDVNGDLPIHLAVKYSYDDIAFLFLRMFPNLINMRGSGGQSLLHLAARSIPTGHQNSMAEHLLTYSDINVNVLNSRRETPLHCAASHGDHQFVKVLLERDDILVNAADRHLWRPIHHAASSRSPETLKLFINDPRVFVNPRNNQGFTPLHLAVQSVGVPAMTQLLLSHQFIRINVQSTEGVAPLHFAVALGNDNAVELLMEKPSINLNIRNIANLTPLHFAAVNDRPSTVSLLLQSPNILVNAENFAKMTPLHIAIQRRYFDVALHLLNDKRTDVNAQNNIEQFTPLHLAIENHFDNLELVEYLAVHKRVNPHLMDSDGQTPLHMAARLNLPQAIEYLLMNKNLNPTIKDKQGNTALHLAVTTNSLDAALILLKRMTPLQINVSGGHYDQPAILSTIWEEKEDMLRLFLDEAPEEIFTYQYQNQMLDTLADTLLEERYAEIIRNHPRYPE